MEGLLILRRGKKSWRRELPCWRRGSKRVGTVSIPAGRAQRCSHRPVVAPWRLSHGWSWGLDIGGFVFLEDSWYFIITSTTYTTDSLFRVTEELVLRSLVGVSSFTLTTYSLSHQSTQVCLHCHLPIYWHNQSTHPPPICPVIHPSIYPTIHSLIHSFTYPFMHPLFIHPSIYPSRYGIHQMPGSGTVLGTGELTDEFSVALIFKELMTL